jgi:hypothetical protein
MYSGITKIYNKKTTEPTLMELFTATGKLKKFFFWQLEMFDACTCVNMLTRVWQELEYRIDVCRVTRCSHIEHLLLSKKNFFSFPVAVNNSIKVGPLVVLL